MKLHRRAALFVLLALGSAFLSYSQEVSEKKELALFKLGHTAWGIPEDLVAAVDAQIKDVFINMRRFDVIGMNQRLDAGDVNQFIDQIKALKGENAVIPVEVQMGKEFFTEADLNRLVGSFIVVIPSVTGFTTHPAKGGYEASIQTTFEFVNVEQGRAFAHAIVDTSGSDDVLEKAVQEAMNGIPLQLTYQVRSIPEFQLRTGIVEVDRRKVILVLGQDMGIKKGDEFAIVSSRVLTGGKTLTTESGLVYIQEVSDELSIGKVIYAPGGAQIGDQLREIPRLGFESTPYLHVVPARPGQEMVALAGARISPLRGFYDFRPVVTIEIPFIYNIIWGIPFNFTVGGEYAMYLGKLQVIPSASFGMGGAYLWYLETLGAEGNEFVFSHLGGNATLSVSYMVNRNIRITADAGYLHWFSMDPTQVFSDGLLFRSYNGLFGGIGASIRF